MGKRSVLVADDDADLREELSDLLREEGFDVVCACDGQDALARLRAMKGPGLILLDLRMPVMDGWQLRAILAQDPVLSSIPVAILSAEKLTDAAARQLGAVAWLPKPPDVGHLLSLVVRHCRPRSRRKGPRPRGPARSSCAH